MYRNNFKTFHLASKLYSYSTARRLSTTFGYQCSKHASLSSTNAYLESSLLNGVSFVVSEPKTCSGVNDFLIELQALDDYPLDKLTLCYRGDDMQQSSENTVMLQAFAEKTGRAYDYITYPLEQILQNGASLDAETAKAKYASMKPLGIDIRYKAMTSFQTCDDMLRSIDAATNALKGDIGVLLVEASPATVSSSRVLVDWARRHLIPVVAVDTLRADASSGSPGMLIDPNVRRTGLPPSTSDLGQAMEDLQRSINACIHAEMQFMERKLHMSAAVPPESVCLGHTLQAVQSSIRYDEEWDYVFRTKLDPEFNAAIEKLKSCSEQHKNFVTLYVPLRKKLNEAYRHVLLVQLRMMCERAVVSAQAMNIPLALKKPTCLIHECILKSLAAMKFDVVCGTNFEIPASEWAHDVESNTISDSSEWPINVLLAICDNNQTM